MIARSALFTAVSGSACTNHCMEAGKRSAEKKLPESNHIGSIATFISPDTASIVRARLATSRPSAENENAPSRVTRANASQEPRTCTPNASIPKPSTATTSITSHTSRASMWESK